MGRPVISIIGPANKSHYWGVFHYAFTRSAIPWEIVFCGNAKPDFRLPENFTYIYSMEFPMKCMERSARAAKGKYLFLSVDDALPTNHKCLDWALYWLQKLPRYSVVGARYLRDGVERNEQQTLMPRDQFSPVCFYTGLMARRDWMELGGIDRRFVGNWGAEDLHLRGVSRGGHAFISPDSVMNEFDNEPGIDRKTHHYPEDRVLLESQWVDYSGIRQLYRTAPNTPVQSYTTEDLEGGI